MKSHEQLVQENNIEAEITEELHSGNSVRIGGAVVDDQSVVEKMYDNDPDRFVRSMRVMAVGSMSEAEVAIDALRSMWDYAVASILSEHAKAISDRAKREVEE